MTHLVAGINRKIDFQAAESERKREWPRITCAICAVKKDKCMVVTLFSKVKRGLPWTRVPPSVCSRHNLGWFTPARKHAPWLQSMAPPQPGFGRWSACTNPDSRKNGVKLHTTLTNAEVKDLHLCRRENHMFAPMSTSVLTLGVALHQIVFVV